MPDVMTTPAANAPVMIMAGGTGGHVFPGIAIADQLRTRGIPVVWMGTRKGIESRVVAEAGIPLRFITISGIRGKGKLALLKAPFLLIRAIIESLQIVRKEKPRCVLGMGGFAAGPGGIAAWLLRRPLLIHEQNAVAGTTNRILSRFATRILTGFPDVLSGSGKAIQVGNPVRESIVRASEQPRDEHNTTRVLVLGGSLGAKALNEMLPRALALIPEAERPEVWHQAGSGKLETTTADYQQSGVDARLVEFIDSMEEAYHWADLVICRAGALTVAEVAASGLPAIFVPLPHAIDDHQTLNARWLASQGAAVVLPQSEMTPEALSGLLMNLVATSGKLEKMAAAACGAAIVDATRRAVDACLEVSNV